MTTRYVAIVGRPNVGKSTLFNRLAGKKLAIVEDIPGVTRDRHYAEVEREGRSFTIIDTGGFVPGEADPLLVAVRDQAQLAIDEADVILFVVDGKHGLAGPDEDLAAVLRRSGKPVVLVVNKLDDVRKRDENLSDFHRLGLTDVVGVSAEHATGIQELDEHVVAKLPPLSDEEQAAADEATSRRKERRRDWKDRDDDENPDLGEGPDPEHAIRVAIVGRPNVGKSTLVNALIGEDRQVASEIPGTTRDPIDSELEHNGRKFILTDTAGIRRKRSIAQRVEAFAVIAALKAIERSDVAVVLLDATEPAVDQDARLVGIAEEKGRAVIVVVNKWDQIREKGGTHEATLRDDTKLAFKFISYAPVIFTSALTGSKVDKVLELAAALYDQWHHRSPTPQLNRLLEHIIENHPSPIIGGKQLRLYYISQVGICPPAFRITTNRPTQVPESYKRYISNQLRKTFDLRVPIRIFFRERPGKQTKELPKRMNKAKSTLKAGRPRKR